jgi:hypothetical protein
MKQLGKLNKEQKRLLAKAIKDESEEVMTASKEQVPVDTGALRSTGHVQDPVTKRNEVSITMGYGGIAGPGGPFISKKTGKVVTEVGYAVAVHENLDAHHKVGNAKFLERPFLAARREIDRALARALEKANKMGPV